jgi:hypothetical protein
MPKEFDDIIEQGWDVEMGDFERLLSVLTDLDSNISRAVSDANGNEKLSDLKFTVGKITSTLSELPNGLNKNLESIAKQQIKIVNSLNNLNQVLGDISKKKPEKIDLTVISKELGKVGSAFRDAMTAVIKASTEENKKILHKLESIASKPAPKPLKHPSWDFEIVRDEDGLINRIIAEPK